MVFYESFKILFPFFLILLACWESEPHDRPSFEDILLSLDRIQRSEFTQTPHESFHTLQDNWKVEIEEVLHDLRMKEKVKKYILEFLNFTLKVINYKIFE